MTKRFLVTIGIMGAISVLMGAVGAHILEDNISDKYLNMFNTANEFLMYHALALIGLTAMNRNVSRSIFKYHLLSFCYWNNLIF